jgi:hypothetical protein
MRILSLWQPHASACLCLHPDGAAKRNETRPWSTGYRGAVLIHATKRKVIAELIRYSCLWGWCGALSPLGLRMGGDRALDDLLPFGAVIGVVDLVDCRPTDSFTVGELDTVRLPAGESLPALGWTERQMGNYSPGRFGLVFANPRLLPEPIPWSSRQGKLLDVPAELESAVRGALTHGGSRT